MTAYRLCGGPWDYVSLPEEENSREGWRMSRAVLAPRQYPEDGMRVELEGVDYIVAKWEEVPLDDAPDPCRRGRQPNEGIFELVLRPAG